MGRGRPRIKGPRAANGRLIAAARVPANDVVTARRDWFGKSFGQKVTGDTHDSIGRAWAAGCLDNPRHDPAALRDIGRRYAHLHDVVFAATIVATASLEPRSKGTGTGRAEDPPGERYAVLDRYARDAGAKERAAMRKLCIEASTDSDPLWLARLIRCRAASVPPEPRDAMILTQAVRALVAMVEG